MDELASITAGQLAAGDRVRFGGDRYVTAVTVLVDGRPGGSVAVTYGPYARPATYPLDKPMRVVRK